MAPRSPSLSKVVKGKQKPIPVKIVSDSPNATPTPKGGVDQWEAQDALRTLQRAAEIQSNKSLMRAAKREADAQIKALSRVK